MPNRDNLTGNNNPKNTDQIGDEAGRSTDRTDRGNQTDEGLRGAGTRDAENTSGYGGSDRVGSQDQSSSTGTDRNRDSSTSGTSGSTGRNSESGMSGSSPNRSGQGGMSGSSSQQGDSSTNRTGDMGNQGGSGNSRGTR